jgi:XTP/dITP diphosphohydrolase
MSGIKGGEFIAATNNAGKLEELRDILRGAGWGCLSLGEVGIDIEIEETGATFLENARIKARAVGRLSGMPVIADDSGLCVYALGGEPGLRSARYAGERGDEANIDKLLGRLKGVPGRERGARFIAALCAVLPGGIEVTAMGWCDGFIGPFRRGTGGFGYDPVFWTRGNRSFAELPQAVKNGIGHRGRAARKLAFKLRGISRANWPGR